MDTKKVNPWSNEEVQTFLCLASDEKLQCEIDAPRNERAYQILAERMALHGFKRSSQQCREKLKKMKSDYFRIKKQTATQDADRKKPIWYDKINAIYGRRKFITTSQHGLPDVMALSSLRLLVSPLQLMAAALWGIVQHRAVMHYEQLEDFITAVLDIIPELLTHSERVQVVLGLRAKVVLEMCQSDDLRNRPNIEPHLKRIDDLINQEEEEIFSSTMKASVAHFIKVVNILLEDPYERDMFYLETFPSVFGFNFDSALCALVRKFLMNLEKLLPVPNLDQTSLWLGLCPPVLKECGDILNQPDPLSKLIQYYKHGHTFVSECGDDSIFSSFSQIRTEKMESKALQKCKGFAPEDDVAEEHVGEVTEDVTLPLDDNVTDPQGCNTSVAFVYKRQSGSGKNFRCLLCDQCFGSLCEMKRHSIAGCSVDAVKEKTCGWRKDDEPLLKESEANVECSLPSNKSGEAGSESPEALQESWSSDSSEEQMCKRSSRKMTCSVCGETFSSSTDLTSHTRAHTEASSHVCGQCDEEFDNYDKYMLHQEKGCKTSRENVMYIDYSQEMLGGQTDLNCSDSILIETCNSLGVVPENNDTQSEFHPNQSSKESEKTTTNQSTMKCTLCDKTFSNLIIMRRHYHYTHNMKHHFPCPTCKRTFVRLYDLVKHNENGLLFQCNTCKWCYTSESELSNHKKLFNDTCALFYTCEICGKSFKEARHLKRHETVHFTDEEKPVCSYCDKTFSSKMALEVHMNRHTGGFSCSICAKVFHQKIFLKRHMDRHNGQEPYLCEICGKGWPTEKYLKVHMIKHSDERPFTCDQCGMTFKSEATLKSHHRSKHTNVRPFKCSVCSKAFAFSKGLKLHMMKHTGIRPFVCSRCGKGFRRSDELKTHQITKCF